MPNKSFKIGDDIYDIPDQQVGAFLKDNPNAIEVNSFKMDKDTFDIPINEVGSFLKDNPDAQPLKKKDSGTPGSTESADVTATGTKQPSFGYESAIEAKLSQSAPAKPIKQEPKQVEGDPEAFKYNLKTEPETVVDKDRKFLEETARKLKVAPTREDIYAKTYQNIKERSDKDVAALEGNTIYRAMQNPAYQGMNADQIAQVLKDQVRVTAIKNQYDQDWIAQGVKQTDEDLANYSKLTEQDQQNKEKLQVLETAYKGAPTERPTLYSQALIGATLPAMSMILRMYPEALRQGSVITQLLQGRSLADATAIADYQIEKDAVGGELLNKAQAVEKAHADFQRVIQDARPESKDWKEELRQVTEDAVASTGYTIPLIGAYYTGNPSAIASANYALFNQSVGSRWDQIKDDPNKTAEGKVADAVLHGTAEVLFEQLGALPVSGLYKQVGKAMSKEAFADAFKEANKGAVKQWLKQNGIAASFVGEGAEELYTGMSQRAVDYLTMKEKPKDEQGNTKSFEDFVYDKDQMFKEFTTGMAMGTLLTVPAVAVNAGATIKDLARKTKINDWTQKINTLQADIDNIGDNPEVKDALKSQAAKYQQEIVNSADEDHNEWENKPQEIKDKASYISNEIDQISNALVNPTAPLSDEAKTALEGQLEEKQKALEELKSIEVEKVDQKLNNLLKDEQQQQIIELFKTNGPIESVAGKGVYNAITEGSTEDVNEAISIIVSQYGDNPEMTTQVYGKEIIDKVLKLETNDSKNNPGVSSEERIRKEPEQTQFDESTSTSKIGNSGIFQEPQEEVKTSEKEDLTAHEEHAAIEDEIHKTLKTKDLIFNDEQVSEIATLYASLNELPFSYTAEEAIDSYIEHESNLKNIPSNGDTNTNEGQQTEEATGEETEGLLNDQTQEGEEKAPSESFKVGDQVKFLDNIGMESTGQIEEIKGDEILVKNARGIKYPRKISEVTKADTLAEKEKNIDKAKSKVDQAQKNLDAQIKKNKDISGSKLKKKLAPYEEALKKAQEDYDGNTKGDANNISESGEKQYSEINIRNAIKSKRIDVAPIEGVKPKTISAIILDLSKGVRKDILYSKKMASRGGLGYYNPSNAATKIRYRGDIDVTAHEIGHALDDKYGILSGIPEDQIENVRQELLPFSEHGSKPKENNPNPDQYIMGEGVAEWIRAFLVNPDAAISAAPKFYEIFDNKVPVDVKNGLKQFSDDIRAFAGATNIDKLKASIDFDASKKKNSLLDFLKPTVSNEEGFRLTFLDRVATRLLNPFRATDVAFKFAMGEKGITDVLPENDSRVLGKLFLGINDKVDNILEKGWVDGKNNRVKDEATGKPMNLEWLLEPFDQTDDITLKRESEDMISVLVAKRIQSKYLQFEKENIAAEAEGKEIPHKNIEHLVNAGGGMFKNMDVIVGVLQEFDELKEDNPQKAARLEEGMRRYQAFADEILRYQVEKGRLSLSDYQKIKKENAQYVGLGRMMDAGPNEEIIERHHGSGNIGSVKDFDKFKGSDRMIKNPYEFLLESMYKGIKEADRNEVLRTFVDMAMGAREMHEGTPNKLATIAREASDRDPNTIDIFDGGHKRTIQFDDDVYATLKNLQDLSYNLPWIATAVPSMLRWSVTNFPVFALRNRVRDFQSRLILSKSGTKPSDIFNKPKDIKDRYELFGGGQAGYYLTEEGFYYNRLERATKDLAGTNTIVMNPVDAAKQGWEGYKKLLGSSERATRLEEYNAAYLKAKASGMDNYNANLYAAYQARDLMDFAVMGTWMRYINQVVPFSNAAVQGLRKMVNTAVEDPKGFATRLTLYSVLPAVITRLMASMFGGDDEWYQRLPAYQRDLFYNFRIGDNKILAIPKPYELGMMGSFTERLTDRFIFENKRAFDGHAGTVARSFFPFDEATLAGPYAAGVEVAANYDFFRGRHIMNPDEERLITELRNTDYASRIGRAVQETVGIDARNVDFVIKRLTSYYGDLGLRLSDIGTGKGAEFGWETTGFIKRDPVSNSRDVSWIVDKAAEFGVSTMHGNDRRGNPLFAQYVELRQMISSYYDASSDRDRAEIGRSIRDYATKVRDTWESGMLEKQKQYLLNKKNAYKKK